MSLFVRVKIEAGGTADADTDHEQVLVKQVHEETVIPATLHDDPDALIALADAALARIVDDAHQKAREQMGQVGRTARP